MNLYIATASSDWGGIFYDKQIHASSLTAAAARAARFAKELGRKRPKQIVLKVTYAGTVSSPIPS